MEHAGYTVGLSFTTICCKLWDFLVRWWLSSHLSKPSKRFIQSVLFVCVGHSFTGWMNGEGYYWRLSLLSVSDMMFSWTSKFSPTYISQLNFWVDLKLWHLIRQFLWAAAINPYNIHLGFGTIGDENDVIIFLLRILTLDVQNN